MTKILRPGKNIVAFGSNAEGTERTTFGTTTQANDLESNLNDSYARGWGIVAASDLPTKQDFNAMGYTLGQLTAYLYQMGIAEYSAAQEYHQNSFTNYNGVIYRSLINNNVGNTPSSSTTKWENFIDGKYLPLTGGTLTGALNVKGSLQENGQRVYSPNNKPTAAIVGALPLAGGTVTGDTNFTGKLQRNGSDVLTKNDFTGGFSENDYQKLPNGLIIQWGEFTSTGGSRFQSVNFPINFPNACLFAIAAINEPNTPSYVGSVVSVSMATFSVGSYNAAQAGKYKFFAIGY